MAFEPNWRLSARDHLAVLLTLALSRHIPKWPGATDEQLEAVAEDCLAILAHVPVETTSVTLLAQNGELRQLREIETEAIRFALDYSLGNVSEAAKGLHIGRNTIYRRICGKLY